MEETPPLLVAEEAEEAEAQAPPVQLPAQQVAQAAPAEAPLVLRLQPPMAVGVVLAVVQGSTPPAEKPDTEAAAGVVLRPTAHSLGMLGETVYTAVLAAEAAPGRGVLLPEEHQDTVVAAALGVLPRPLVLHRGAEEAEAAPAQMAQ